MNIDIRKFVIQLEETFHDGGPVSTQPYVKGAIAAVIRNPYSGQGYVEDIMEAMDALKPLGLQMARRLVDALGGDSSAIEGYGKGAIVGANGELEHGALWHAPGGYGMRELLGDTAAVVPSTKKVGGMGCRIDIPISHINATYVRSHFDAIEVGFADGPKADELVLIQAMSTGPRIHSRIGGLAASDIEGKNGLR